MTERQIQAVDNNPRAKVARLKQELRRAKKELVEAQGTLAREQAEVNAFRMHCRLKLDVLVDTFLDLRATKQALLTRLQLLQQAQELGVPYDEDDPFWRAEEDEAALEEPELLLPTDTPRDKAAEKRLYRELARQFHPDLARSAVERAYRTSVMAAVNAAYAANDLSALYDLAGELDPQEVAELAGIETVEIRDLREMIMKCRRQERKARRELQTLRRENTARLWQRAQELEQNGQDWWSVVRRELERAIVRRQAELEVLQARVAELEEAQAREADAER